MMLELTAEEREMLATLVEREVADLGPEIRHTDDTTYRDELKVHKQELRHLLDHLRAVEHV
ncbi:MAG: hypothetical protein JXA69_13350 [Phycisphaerae bacterium]|nr:hypothetical protein [Phycisphaerae bacterium]